MEYTQEQLADFKLEATRRRQRAFVVVGLATILLLGLAVIFKQIGKGGGLWAILLGTLGGFRVWLHISDVAVSGLRQLPRQAHNGEVLSAVRCGASVG